ncbi:immediate early response gene 2 protein [Embiotoca jacksoni]|uniref:immediate early response gene 2 protein n=1 Tax=Embiotoca jacksoni TaxID=100190 RepID=UPI00370461E4
MEVSAEAKRIMVVALGKLYSSRTQRGGLRLHRSLLLTLVMKSARDIYHAAQTTAESVASECEQQQQQQQQQQQHHTAAEVTTEPAAAPELQRPASVVPGQPRAFPGEEVARRAAGNKENVRPAGPAQHTRKRRGKAAAEPDFLPCKKARLERGSGPRRLIVNSVLMDYAKCSSELGAPSPSIPLQRAVAAC